MCRLCNQLALAVLADRLRLELDRPQPVEEAHAVEMAVTRGQTARDIAFLVDHAPAFVGDGDEEQDKAVAEMSSYLAGMDGERLHRLHSWSDWMRDALTFTREVAMDGLLTAARNGDSYARSLIIASIQQGILDPRKAEGIPGVIVQYVKPGDLGGKRSVAGRIRPEDLQ